MKKLSFRHIFRDVPEPIESKKDNEIDMFASEFDFRDNNEDLVTGVDLIDKGHRY